MLNKYLNFIKENYDSINEGGSEGSPSVIYYDDEDYNNILKMGWTNIRSKKDRYGTYLIQFKVPESSKDGRYDNYQVIIKNEGGKEEYLMQEPEKFKQKFKMEFFKNETAYYKDMIYVPKILGDISHLKDSDKYNI